MSAEVLRQSLNPPGRVVNFPSAPLRGRFPVTRALARQPDLPGQFHVRRRAKSMSVRLLGDPEHAVHMQSVLISRYQKRLSGPLFDRIDIHVEVPRVPFQKLSSIASTTSAAANRRRPRFGQRGRWQPGRGNRPGSPK